MRGNGMEYEHNTSAGDGCNLCQTAMLFSLLWRDSNVNPVLIWCGATEWTMNTTLPQEMADYEVAAYIGGGELLRMFLRWQHTSAEEDGCNREWTQHFRRRRRTISAGDSVLFSGSTHQRRKIDEHSTLAVEKQCTSSVEKQCMSNGHDLLSILMRFECRSDACGYSVAAHIGGGRLMNTALLSRQHILAVT